MNWPDLSMGGYGFYVWGSYIFALLAIVWELVTLSYRRKSREQEKDRPGKSYEGLLMKRRHKRIAFILVGLAWTRDCHVFGRQRISQQPRFLF